MKQELHRYFTQLDLNGDGHISASELYLVFKALKMQHSPDSVNTLIRTVDRSGNDEIEFDEFVRVRPSPACTARSTCVPAVHVLSLVPPPIPLSRVCPTPTHRPSAFCPSLAHRHPQLMEKVKFSRPNDWSQLLGKLDTSLWQKVMNRTADAFGLKDEEVDRRDVHLYRQKSYFARKDVKPVPKPDNVVVSNLKRGASKMGIGPKRPPPQTYGSMRARSCTRRETTVWAAALTTH